MSKTTTEPILWLPSAADGIQIAASGTAWANGAWVQLTASAPSTLHAAFLAVLPNDGAIVTTNSAEIDIGIGAASSEVVVATVHFRFMADLWGPVSTVPLGVIRASIASGSRVALRIRHGLTSNTTVYRVALGYYASLDGATGYTATTPGAAPGASNGTTVTSSATAWTFGSWVQLLSAASVTTNILITGVVAAAIDRPHELQIGTGGAGSETAILTLPYAMTAGGGNGFNYVRFPRPICVNTGTRIAMRTRNGGTTSPTFSASLWYVANT